MFPFARRWTRFFLLAALVTISAGCGGKKGDTEPGLTQAEANDLAQTLAAMAATDSGGWFVKVQTTVDRWREAAQPLAMAPFFTLQDTTFQRGNMNWVFNYMYFGAGGSQQSVIDSSTIRIEAYCAAKGHMPLSPFEGSTGFGLYEHKDSIYVDGLRAHDSSLAFIGLSDLDTSMVTITSGTSARYYYFNTLVGISLDMSKNPPPTRPPYPVRGTATLDAFVGVLRNTSRLSRVKSLDATMTIVFDGTQTPPASITANTVTPTTVYLYYVDLKTGTLTPR